MFKFLSFPKLVLSVGALVLTASGASAQTPFGSLEEASASTKYVRIVNNNTRYDRLCIQDSASTANGTNYALIVTHYQPRVYRQYWKLVSASATDTTAYYLRNFASRNYLSATVNYHKGNLGVFYLPTMPSGKANGSVWTFTRLSNGQYVISSEDAYGLRRYLAPCDTLRVPSAFGSIERSENSVFAWTLYDANSDLTGISAVVDEPEAGVGVVDGRVVVAGATECKIFDMSGRLVPSGRRLPAGVYIVVANRKSYKVMVK